MFFNIFIILFFLKYLPINSLRCMTGDSGSILSLTTCTFQLNINEPIPDDSKLAGTASKCGMHEANIISLFGHSDGSCYAEVSIDYSTKKMIFEVTHVTLVQSKLSPYDDMFGFANGIKSIVQYKINGNLEKEKLIMTTRIQCKTYDNCALDKLRKLLPNLIISNTRVNIFKEVVKFLNDPNLSPESSLECKDENDADLTCAGGEDRCEFDRSKDLMRQGCVDDPSEDYDIEYRFNVIEEISDEGTDNSAKSFKLKYLCKTNFCNSDNNVQQVDKLLNSLALVSSSSSSKNNPSTNTNNKSPAAQANNNNNKPSNKPKSTGASFLASYRYQSIIIFSLLIQILSN